MVDMCLCPHTDENNCKKRLKCYRYTAQPSEYQWYSDFYLRKPCEDFIPNKEIK